MARELRNESLYEFTDISNEESRTYSWADGSRVMIQDPQWLAVSATGHYVLDVQGESHYIPLGWRHLRWKAQEGQPQFPRR